MMNKFYFFKVTLSYFDDETKTFFITPDRSETDDRGVPFSENDLRNTEEFKSFVKTTKADVIDVDYTEYAAEYDPKKHDITGKPVSEESFAELEKSGQLEIVDENQILLLLREKKTSGGKKSGKGCLPVVIAAAAFVIGLMAGAAYKGGSGTSSDASEISETSEITPESESGDESASSEQSAAESAPNAAESTAASPQSADSTESTAAPEPSDDASGDSSAEISEEISGESSEDTHEAAV